MTLITGTHLGPYEILSALGAGGMGEVYRARDTRLNRDVAIKVLPDLFASDADRLVRVGDGVEKGLTPGGCNMYIRTVNGYLSWLKEEGTSQRA